MIVVRACGRFLEGFARFGGLYCNSYESVCQEVSRVNIWDAVIKEKGEERNCTLRFYADAWFNKMKKVTVPNIIC